VVWPLAALGQQVASKIVGVIGLGSLESLRTGLAPFQRRLAEMGYVEERNLVVEYRAADNQEDRLAALAGDLVQRRVDAIAVFAGQSSPPQRLPPHLFQSFSLRGLTPSQVDLSQA
jgi:putative ABC transport system substrate-binding protein